MSTLTCSVRNTHLPLLQHGFLCLADPQDKAHVNAGLVCAYPSPHYLITTQTVSSPDSYCCCPSNICSTQSFLIFFWGGVLFLFRPHAYPSPPCALPPPSLPLTAPVPSHSPHSWSEWVESSVGMQDPRRAEGALPHTDQSTVCVQITAHRSASGTIWRIVNPLLH